MTTFVDASGLYALLDEADRYHPAAAKIWRQFRTAGEPLVTHDYVVVEVAAVVCRRLGASALSGLDRHLAVVDISFAGRTLFDRAWAATLAAPATPSFVDRISFELMRDLGIFRAFAFDRDFLTQGFELVTA